MAGPRVLVLKQEGLREFVEAEPAFDAIRRANPDVPIDLLTTPELGRLAKGSPHFNRVLSAGPFADKLAMKSFLNQLKRIGYEQVYDLDGTRETMEIRAALKGFRGPRWIGPKRVMSKPGKIEGFSAPAMRKLLSDAKVAVPERLPSLGWALEGRKDAANMQPSWFGISGAFMLFVPSHDGTTRWPASHYATLAHQLAEADVSAVIVGPDSMGAYGQEVVHAYAEGASGAAARVQVVDLTGKADLAQIAMLAHRSLGFVAGTSDLVHLATALGAPGLLMMHPRDRAEADRLFGREVVKLTGADMNAIAPETASMMLRNMGLLPRGQQTVRLVSA